MLARIGKDTRTEHDTAMSYTEYALPAPIYADTDACADIIGYAVTAPAAVAIYRSCGLAVAGAIKSIQDTVDGDLADGRVPVMAFAMQSAGRAA